MRVQNGVNLDYDMFAKCISEISLVGLCINGAMPFSIDFEGFKNRSDS